MAIIPCPYASRGGLKLEAALREFKLDLAGAVCADLGCNVGGFTDCLLRHGAARVYAVDTGYGTLAWKLRQDQRVVVLERTNALHFDPHTIEGFAGCDLVTVDLAWTRQSHAVPAARRWLRPATAAGAALEPPYAFPLILSLIKPHYEADRSLLKKGILDPEDAVRVNERVLAEIPGYGAAVLGHIRSPILGGAGKGKAGNVEFLALLAPAARPV